MIRVFFSDCVTFTSNYREEAEKDTISHSDQYTSAQGVYQGFFHVLIISMVKR